MTTQYRIEFTELTIGNNETRSTMWYNSIEAIPAKYMGYIGEGNGLYFNGRIVTRELAAMPSLKEMIARRNAAI